MKKEKKDILDIETKVDSNEEPKAETPVESVSKPGVAFRSKVRNTSSAVATFIDGRFDAIFSMLNNQLNSLRLKSRSYKYVMVIAFTLVIAAGLLVLNNFVLKLDRELFDTSLIGYVREQDGLPISGVKVCIGINCTETNSNGQFAFTDLVYGFNKVTFEKEDYKDLNKSSYLSRSDNTKNYILELSGKAIVSGKIEITAGIQDYTKVKITMDDQLATIDPNGNFNIRKVESGTQKLIVASSDYSDVEQEFNLNDGVNNIGLFPLVPAADVTFKVSDFIDGTAIEDAELTTNIETLKITKLESNNFVVKDIDFNVVTSISISASKPGYLNKTQTVEAIKQGENPIGAYDLVKVGRIAFVSNKSGYTHIYSANYDGSEQLLVSDVGDANNRFYTLFSNDEYIGFSSEKDKLKTKNGVTDYVPYVAKVTGGDLRRVGTYNPAHKGPNGRWFDFNNNRMAYSESFGNYYNSSTERYTNLVIASMDGTKEIFASKSGGGSYSQVVFSKDGKFIVYEFFDYGADLHAIYMYNITNGQTRQLFRSATNEPLTIFDISNDSQYVLIRVRDNEYEFEEWKLGTYTNSSQKIFASKVNFNYAKFSLDDKYSFYTASKDGRNNIYARNLETLVEERVTDEDNITDYIFTKEGYILYVTGTGDLKIMSLANKAYVKLVTNEAKGFNYYQDPYSYYY